MLGEAYFKLDRLKEAEHWYREALRAKADHIPAHLTYGKLLTKMVGLIMRTVTLIGTWGRKYVESLFLQDTRIQSDKNLLWGRIASSDLIGLVRKVFSLSLVFCVTWERP